MLDGFNSTHFLSVYFVSCVFLPCYGLWSLVLFLSDASFSQASFCLQQVTGTTYLLSHTSWEFFKALFVSPALWRTHHLGVILPAGLQWMHFEWIINQRCRSRVSAWAIYLDLKCWLRQKCKLINMFLPRWSRIIVPEPIKGWRSDPRPSPCFLPPHTPEQFTPYSRFDFAGESLPQDQSDGGEDRQGGAHGPDPRRRSPGLQDRWGCRVQGTGASPIGRLERWQAAATAAEESRLFLSSLLALTHGWGD